MRPSRSSLIAGTAFVFAVFVMTVVFPGMRDSWVWPVVGSVYVLTIGFGVGVRYVRSRSLRFRDTVGIAALAVVVLVPLTLHMQAGMWGDSTPSFLQYWQSMLSIHFERFVPVAFMFPLGAARKRGRQLGTVSIVLLPTLYELFYWFILRFEDFYLYHYSPERLVVGMLLWLVIVAALGSLLFLVGRRLSHENDIRKKPVIRRDIPDSG